MIFITVGTHEQAIDRLLIEIDKLIEEQIINEEVFAQIGYTNYIPKNYSFETLIGYEKMDSYVKEARVVITHGGPGSIFHPIQYGKIPIVVPRNPNFNEHVDDHQILFTKRLDDSKKVIGVYEIDNLRKAILNYDVLSKKCEISSNSRNTFVNNFSKFVSERLGLKE